MHPVDRLTPLLERFPPSVRVFFSDVVCERIDLQVDARKGHIHWIKSGEVEVFSGEESLGILSGPGVIFSPKGSAHRLTPRPTAELVCAEFEFGQRFNNPLTSINPSVILISVAEAPEIEVIHTLLMREAFSNQCGKSFGVNQLLQYFVLLVFRFLIRTNRIPLGITRALADERLLKALNAMHTHPAKPWSLEDLADEAGMSRASFANHFKEATQSTPMEYLTDWRISLAQTKLVGGMPLKAIAREVGYASPATLTRIFSKRVGQCPRDWLNASRKSSLN